MVSKHEEIIPVKKVKGRHHMQTRDAIYEIVEIFICLTKAKVLTQQTWLNGEHPLGKTRCVGHIYQLLSSVCHSAPLRFFFLGTQGRPFVVLQFVRPSQTVS